MKVFTSQPVNAASPATAAVSHSTNGSTHHDQRHAGRVRGMNPPGLRRRESIHHVMGVVGAIRLPELRTRVRNPTKKTIFRPMPDDSQSTLWDDLPVGSAGLEAEDRWLDDHPQTRIKLAAYEAYLPWWIRTLGVQPTGGELYILDLFAGPGIYRSSSGPRLGSPIIACRAAETNRQVIERLKGYGLLVHLRFVEPRRKAFELLRAAVEKEADAGEYDAQAFNRTAAEMLPSLLGEVGDRPTLALLDPDGVKPLEFTLIEQLSNSWAEVLLSFDVTALSRLAGQDPDAVSRWFGSDGWTQFWRGSTFAYDDLLRQYQRGLTDLFPHTSLGRLVFSRSNRAIAQGARSALATRLWGESFQSAADKHGGLLVNVWRNRSGPD